MKKKSVIANETRPKTSLSKISTLFLSSCVFPYYKTNTPTWVIKHRIHSAIFVMFIS